MIYEALEHVGLARFSDVREDVGTLAGVLGENMPHADAMLLTDLAALCAAELQVVEDGVVTSSDRPEFPVIVQRSTWTIALAKTDTMATWQCPTPGRVGRGELRLSDCFVFAGDVEKIGAILEAPSVRTFRDQFVPVVERYIEQMMETPVGRRIRMARDSYVAAALVWRARLDALSGHRVEDTRERLLALARELQFERALPY